VLAPFNIRVRGSIGCQSNNQVGCTCQPTESLALERLGRRALALETCLRLSAFFLIFRLSLGVRDHSSKWPLGIWHFGRCLRVHAEVKNIGSRSQELRLCRADLSRLFASMGLPCLRTISGVVEPGRRTPGPASAITLCRKAAESGIETPSTNIPARPSRSIDGMKDASDIALLVDSNDASGVRGTRSGSPGLSVIWCWICAQKSFRHFSGEHCLDRGAFGQIFSLRLAGAPAKPCVMRSTWIR